MKLANDQNVNDDLIMVEQAFDSVPVLQSAVVQHLYASLLHMPNVHEYVLLGHVDEDEHEYTVLTMIPAAYVEAVYFKKFLNMN